MANKPKNPVSGTSRAGKTVNFNNAVRDARKQTSERAKNNTRVPLPKKMSGPSTSMTKGQPKRGK